MLEKLLLLFAAIECCHLAVAASTATNTAASKIAALIKVKLAKKIVDVERMSVFMSAGKYHSLVVDKNQKLKTWGFNDKGQLGDGTNNDSYVPNLIAAFSGSNITRVASGSLHSFAQKQGGKFFAWGDNSCGQLGDGTVTSTTIPVAVQRSDYKTIRGGATHSIALTYSGNVFTFGCNDVGQLGDGALSNYGPVQLDFPSKTISISAGAYHSLALLEDKSILAWGYNAVGQLGNGQVTAETRPAKIAFFSKNLNVIQICSGLYHNLALTSDGKIYAWGYNNRGQLGFGSKIDQLLPVLVKNLPKTATKQVVAIRCGGYHSLALLYDGTVLSWGANDSGQMSDGTQADNALPVAVKGLAAMVTGIEAGGLHNIARLANGSVMAWGYNAYGQIGLGNDINQLLARTVPSLLARG